MLTTNIKTENKFISMSRKINKYYIKPEDFQKEYDLSISIDEITPRLFEMFNTIAVNSVVLLKLKNQQDIDAVVNYALTECWKVKWKTYDTKRTTNIFSFFTTVLLNDMRTHKNYIMRHRDRTISIDAIFNGMKEK